MKKTAEGNHLHELQTKLSIEISEKEQLQDENQRLREQIEQFREMFVSTVEFASSIENELEGRLNNHQSTDFDSVCGSLEQVQVEELKENLSLQISINDSLRDENRNLVDEMEKMRIMFANTVEHSSILENELDQKYAEIRLTAITDNLTGIYNRIKFHQDIRAEIENNRRKKKPLSLLMFDIDHFKNVNDTFGHDIGDAVLVGVCAVTNRIKRKSDVFARWGGEEFMVLMPDTELDGAVNVAERIRSAIETESMPRVGHVTCSFGVTRFEPGDDLTGLLKRVDNALYIAKNQGRNRVIVISGNTQA
jgi:diguanylate cyclase (GGDEF)-like protein